MWYKSVWRISGLLPSWWVECPSWSCGRVSRLESAPISSRRQPRATPCSQHPSTLDQSSINSFLAAVHTHTHTHMVALRLRLLYPISQSTVHDCVRERERVFQVSRHNGRWVGGWMEQVSERARRADEFSSLVGKITHVRACVTHHTGSH